MDDGSPEVTPAPLRIDVWRAGRALLLALVVPMTAAVVVDLTLGTLPIAIIAAVVICIPLSTVLVSRTVLAEFDRVIAVVAPVLPPESPPEAQPPVAGLEQGQEPQGNTG